MSAVSLVHTSVIANQHSLEVYAVIISMGVQSVTLSPTASRCEGKDEICLCRLPFDLGRLVDPMARSSLGFRIDRASFFFSYALSRSCAPTLARTQASAAGWFLEEAISHHHHLPPCLYQHWLRGCGPDSRVYACLCLLQVRCLTLCLTNR